MGNYSRLESEAFGHELATASTRESGFYLPGTGESLHVSSDPAEVYTLVRLARTCGKSETYGSHIGLLALVARRSDVEAGQTGPYPEVIWYPAQPIGERPDNLVSLRGWLSEAGYDVRLESL